MKKIKLLILILFITGLQNAFAKDYDELNSFANPDVESTIGPENTLGLPIFNEDSTKVVHTKKLKGKFWRGFSFSNRKKKENFPEVIDYDYNTDTEEIVPVVNEVKNETKQDKKDKKKNNKKSAKSEDLNPSASDINIFCDNMEYFDDRKEIEGTGNAKVVFTENNSVITADKIIYNHDLNYFEGIGNVRITKEGRVMDGDYTKVDLNYGNVMVDKPLIDDNLVRIVAKKGLATTDTIEAYDGTAKINQDFEKRVYSAQHGAFFPMEVDENMYRKFYPKEYRNRGSKYHIKTKELLVSSTDGHDTVTFKNADIYYGKALLLKGSDLRLSTDKTESFVETTLPEIGSMRYVGAFAGPGFVFNTPGSSTLKIAPLLTLDGGKFGLGVLARFRHKRNTTQMIYSTGANEFVLRGRQRFGDSDFFAEYAHMAYMNEWFMGSNISKYLAQIAYEKRYIIPEIAASFAHRATAGYITDEYGHTGTARFRYQAMLSKNIVEYRNYDKKFMAALDISTQGMMGVYGTGDSVGVFRIGPSIRTQYRGWGQQIAYYQSAKGGESPLKNTDDYRYGNSTLHITENLRLNKYISLGYYAALNLMNDDPITKNMFSESRIMISFGPDDAKLSFGYDMIRQGTMLNYTALLGSKNQDVAFKKLFMKNPSKLGGGKKEKKENKFMKWLKGEYSEQEVTNTKNEISKEEINDDLMEAPAVFNFGVN